MPVRRSARTRAPAASIATSPRRASTTTKSLPSPCIFLKAILAMARLYGGPQHRVQLAVRSRDSLAVGGRDLALDRSGLCLGGDRFFCAATRRGAGGFCPQLGARLGGLLFLRPGFGV